MDENITIEFVKEWIEKHKLSKGSFDRIMNDLIYNSGHNYIDNPYLRDWLIKNTQKFQDLLPVELNENQQVVLEYLKDECLENDLQYTLWEFTDNVYEEPATYSVSEQTKAWLELTEQEQFQVLAAFAEWGMKNEQ
ncbi:hypothetical protein [Enterococcus raffinosus]|uniref:Uncharacterized protein n=3 Tax=Enterococcus raffinosus TaxID=71452 RepID=A0AAW8TIE9_9ENTE|nr:hypothetical protein [Enterococcus raffinosus]MDT2546902.1 hypothetical protein [Enterococcus raffinosus]MDT2580372.1 hypothetical protein [Enterococcus raffinosus]